jgi:hypothetical protein
VDVGARYASWVTAEPDGSAVSRIFASGGLSSPALVGPGGPSRLARSMPYAIDELAVADALQNLRARPATIPQTEDELAVAHAAVRHILGQMAAEVPSVSADLVIGGGRTLATTPTPAQAAQLLVDGLRPLGVTQLAIDPAGAMAPLGSLDDVELGEGIASLRDDLIVPLGASVVCRGGRPGQVAMAVTVHRTGWPSVGPIEVRSGPGSSRSGLGRGFGTTVTSPGSKSASTRSRSASEPAQITGVVASPRAAATRAAISSACSAGA